MKNNFSKSVNFFIVLIGSVLFLTSCGNKKKATPYDTPLEGTIHISVDESFKPVISEEIKVYESSYPKTHIIATYKSEADCFRDLQQDSTRMIIVAKGLTPVEEKYYDEKLSFEPQFGILAWDAVCAIININSKDSLFTLKRLNDILSGKDSSLKVVVDGDNATSTVRYLQDSVLFGKPFGKNVMAANGSKGVIDYVSNNTGVVGFVGSSWVTNDEDPEQLAYLTKIKFALLQCRICDSAGMYAKPSQATISYDQYPLVRPLYYILKENTTGLGTGFSNFLNLERGQLVFRRSTLVPGTMYFGVRTSNISKTSIK